MRTLLMTTVMMAIAAPAMAGNWYIVAGATGHCKISQFTPEAFKIAVVKEPGSDPVTVMDKSDPKDNGVVELAVRNDYSGTVNGMVFVNNAARCESVAQLIAASHMLPWQAREAIKNAPR